MTIPSLSIQEVEEAFSAAGNPVVKGKACCPLHGDTHPSMSVSVKNGRLIVHCYVCGIERQREVFSSVIGQIGEHLPKSETFAENRGKTMPSLPKPGGSLSPLSPRDVFESAEVIEEGSSATLYLKEKVVGGYGVRRGRDGALYVPMRNVGGFGEIVGFQKVYLNGDKLNHPGSKPRGTAHLIGYGGHLEELRHKTVILCEGYATAASVYELSREIGQQVIAVCCFGVSNIPFVAREIAGVLRGLDGAKLLISPDNDAAGREVATALRAEFFAVELPVVEGFGEGNDWNDLVRANKPEAEKQLTVAFLQAEPPPVVVRKDSTPSQEQATLEQGRDKKATSKTGRPKKQRAGYKEYLDLVKSVYGEREPSLDLVSGEIKVFEHGGWRVPSIKALRSAARLSDGMFDHNAILDHLDACAREMTPQILLDKADKWDGRDRIAVFSKALCAENFSAEELRILIGHWLVGVLRKANDPSIQNRVLVLQGASGCGKDVWIKNLLRVFVEKPLREATVRDGYVSNLTVSGMMTEEDYARFMYRYLVVNISEFDKTKGDYKSAAIFKSITTAEFVSYRPKYEESVVSRPVRASIVASLNPKEINEDSAGARRYLPIELLGKPFNRIEGGEKAAIDWGYIAEIEREGEKEFYLQLRAQVFEEYEAAPGEVQLPWNVQDSLQEVQDGLTPADPVTETIEAVWEAARAGLKAGTIHEDGLQPRRVGAIDGVRWKLVPITAKAMQGLLREECGVGVSPQRVLMRMNQYRLSWRTSSVRGWYIPVEKEEENGG